MIFRLTTVPVLFNHPLNVWLGLTLAGLVAIQVTIGAAISMGKGRLIIYHKLTASLIILVLLVHGYYGIGISFFGFALAK